MISRKGDTNFVLNVNKVESQVHASIWRNRVLSHSVVGRQPKYSLLQ